MTVKQLSVFVENKQGRLSAVLQKLAESRVDISALSLADSSEFGVLRLIVSDPALAKTMLEEEGVVVKITDVIAVAMNDRPGGAAEILSLFADNGISVDYMYACAGSIAGKALMIVKVDRVEDAQKLLSRHESAEVSPSDIYRI